MNLINSAARLSQMGGADYVLWLTTNPGPECTPLDDMEFRINVRAPLGLPVVQRTLCQHQRRQKPDGVARGRCLAHLDEHGQFAQKCVTGGVQAMVHDVGCHTIHSACCEAGLKSQREVGSVVSGLAWERAKLPTCFGGLGIRFAQMGFAAQATYWSAIDLRKAAMSIICEALDTPLRAAHLEGMTALAAEADLLLSGVAVDEYDDRERGQQLVRGKPVGGGQAGCRDCPPGSCAGG